MEESECLKLRKFQSFRAVTPCQWIADDIKPLCIPPPPDLPPRPKEVIPVADPAETDPVERPPGEKPKHEPKDPASAAPVSGPPKAWIQEHGPTPNCSACDHIKRTGKSHSKVHNSECRKRYKQWLRDQAALERNREREEQDAKEQDAKCPRLEDQAPGPGIIPMEGLVLPGSSDDVPNPSVAGPPNVEDERMDPPVPENDEMEIDKLVCRWMDEQENKFLSSRDRTVESVNVVQKWVEAECLGKKVFQSFPEGMSCEMSGQKFDEQQLKEGFQKEFEQLTDLKVGKWVSESEARSFSAKHQKKLLGTRWVPGLVRARLVAKDFRAAGLSSLREGLYAPTASLESLRLFLALAELYIQLLSLHPGYLHSLSVCRASPQ